MSSSSERQAIDAGDEGVIDYSPSDVSNSEGHCARHMTVAKRVLFENNILAALPHIEYRSLVRLDVVALQFGTVLHEQGMPIRHVYFPVDSTICMITSAEDRLAVEVGLVGFEGMVGVSLALDTDVSSVRALTIARGTALRMEASDFQQALRRCPQLLLKLRRYAHVKLAAARKAVACKCFHSVEARLARWLLMISDRARSQEVFLTQEFLADMFGVRRCTVTEAAGDLQRRALIRYTRGNIRILDRWGLEGTACLCYSRIEDPHEAASHRKS